MSETPDLTTDRGRAKMATILAYRNRVIGGVALRGQAPLFGIRKVECYRGDFPYEDIAEKVDLPISPALNHHQNAWARLYDLFNRSWAKFEQTRG